MFHQLYPIISAFHRHGVVHRDVKPNNVIAVVTDDEVNLFLNDFEYCCPVGQTGFAGTDIFASPYHKSGYLPEDDLTSLLLTVRYFLDDRRMRWVRHQQTEYGAALQKIEIVRKFLKSDDQLLRDTAQKCFNTLRDRVKRVAAIDAQMDTDDK